MAIQTKYQANKRGLRGDLNGETCNPNLESLRFEAITKN